ncbi:MAG: toll/interleukin-1 receptor domain-containing protein [Lewinellaceae bacterium]|nr:toll/interleukin-1 receptor domain-containing protein [Lewinellaceae bacterium]
MPDIYISYAWKDREQTQDDSREHIVDQFCEACKKRGYTVLRDKSTLSYRDSIENFMRQIGAGKYVLVVVSDKYLFSEYCMFEAVKLLAHERFEERVFPIVLPESNVFNAEKSLDYKVHWQDKLQAFSRKLDAIGRSSGMAEMLLKERDYKEIDENVLQFVTRISKMNVLPPKALLDSGFKDIFAALEKQIAKDNAPEPKTTPGKGPASLKEPAFPKFDLRNKDKFRFEHALRPAQTKTVVSKFPASLNIVADKGQGRRRFMEDLATCGIENENIRVVHIKLPVFLNDWDAFLQEVARQADISLTESYQDFRSYIPNAIISGITGKDLVELLRESAVKHRQPVLFILENLEVFFEAPEDMDSAFGIGFLQKLNALKNRDFCTLLVSSHRSVNHSVFKGISSPLTLDEIKLNLLSDENLRDEILRRMPDIAEDARLYLQEQLESDPNHTYQLLEELLNELEGHPKADRKDIKRMLIDKRQKMVGYGRK